MKGRYAIKPVSNTRMGPVIPQLCSCLGLLLVVLICAAMPQRQRAESAAPARYSSEVKTVVSRSDAKEQTADTKARSVTLDFDSIDASFGRLVASAYLARFGITVKDVTPGTLVVIIDTRKEYEGHATVASSKPNALTQINSNDPVSFTLDFDTLVQTVRFTRPALLAGPTGVTFPEWSAQALDSQGRQLDEVGEPLGQGHDYYTNVPAKRCTLNGPAIKSVRFYSNNHQFAAFNAVLVDDLTLIP